MATIAAQNVQILAQILAGRMLNCVVEGGVISLFAWVLLRLLRRQSSSTRFAAWLMTLVAVAALPFFETLHSSLAEAAGGGSFSALRLPAAWGTYLLMAWLFIATGALGKIVFGLVHLRQLRRGCEVIEPERLHPMVQNTLREFGSSRRIKLCVSSQVTVPAAIGFLQPVIILPPWAFKDLSPVELNAVLLHELAHLRRWDDWTNLAQQVLRAIFFFHPAVWWIARGLSREREMACDDFALAVTSSPRAYAQCLVSVAEKSFARRSLALAQAVVGRVHHTAQRVARIFDMNRPPTTRVWHPALGLLATFLGVCLISLPQAPRLVEFEGQVSSRMASSVPVSVPANDPSARSVKAIPAAFHRPAGTGMPLPSAPRISRASLRSRSDPGRPVVFAPRADKATVGSRGLPGIRVVEANQSTSIADLAPPKAVFLVMQTGQVDDSGRMSWSIAIWRLTTVRSTQQPAHHEIVPKTT